MMAFVSGQLRVDAGRRRLPLTTGHCQHLLLTSSPLAHVAAHQKPHNSRESSLLLTSCPLVHIFRTGSGRRESCSNQSAPKRSNSPGLLLTCSVLAHLLTKFRAPPFTCDVSPFGKGGWGGRVKLSAGVQSQSVSATPCPRSIATDTGPLISDFPEIPTGTTAPRGGAHPWA